MNKALQVLIGILPLYIIRFSIGGIPTNAFEVVALAIFIAGVINPHIRQEWLRTIRTARPIYIGWALVLIASACVAVGVSHEIRVSLGILKGWVMVPALVGFVIAAAVHSSRVFLQQYVHTLALSGTVVAWIGIVQIGTMGRVHSLYDVPNSLALFLVPILIIALYRGVQRRNKFLIFCGMSMVLAVCATGSLGAFFALIGTGLLIALHARLHNVARLVALLIIFVGLGAVFIAPRIPYFVSPIIHTGATNSATVRLQLWDIGIRLVAQHPILGIGLGQFEPLYQDELHQLFIDQQRGLHPTVYSLQPEFVFRDPHNWILSMWLNLSVVGLAAFCSMNWLAIRRGVASRTIERRAVAFGLIAMLLYGLVDTIYWKNDLAALWWMLTCLLLAS